MLMERILIIGGGLAGLVAAGRLSQANRDVVIVDTPPVELETGLGGFALFSGAKFSLPPAGMGLAQVAGSTSALFDAILEVLRLLQLDHRADLSSSRDATLSNENPDHPLIVRSYESIVLTPDEMKNVIAHLHLQIDSRVRLIRGRCSSLSRFANGWRASIESEGSDYEELRCRTVIYAGGRSGSSILISAGAEPRLGKGLDVGLRVEFEDKAALSSLRSLGPDAKIIQGECRTFCLNVPGKVFRYESDGVPIPGGVVARADHPGGNVGLLCRVSNKATVLRMFRREFPSLQASRPLLALLRGLGMAREATRTDLSTLYGTEVANRLVSFSEALAEQALIDWSEPHTVHLPLLDWHWDVFALGASFQTTVPDLYVIGDSAGHARGLLQAAVSGWLVSEALNQ